MLELLTFVSPARAGRPAKNEVFAPNVRIVSREKWIGVFVKNDEGIPERIAKFKGENAAADAAALRDSLIAKAREAVEARNAEIAAHNAAEAARLVEAEARAKAALEAEAEAQNGAAPVETSPAPVVAEDTAPEGGAEASQEGGEGEAELTATQIEAPAPARSSVTRRPVRDRKPKAAASE